MLGAAMDWVTQQWVKRTGRRRDLLFDAWLDGPVGGAFIGDRWLDGYAKSVGAEAVRSGGGGLVPSLAALDQPGFSAEQLSPTVVEFYETTSDWRLEVWSRWSPWFRPFGVILSALFARRLQQLNLPLDPMETSRGMTSDVIPIVSKNGSVLGSAWQRTLRATGQTVFGGYYGIVDLPSWGRPAVRVVFPLPNGSITVFLRPENAQGGAFRLVSDGSRWGEPGAYLVVRGAGPTFWSRRVPLPERFEVYVDDEGVLRADHHLHFLRWRVLQMHYRIERTASASETETHA
jgi:hypothetical protein